MADHKPLPDADAVLVDVLGRVVAELKLQWQKELQLISAESRATIAEIRAAALEAVLEDCAPATAAKLRAIGGG
jgi:hypothetical protein